jgi:hypothetical protein
VKKYILQKKHEKGGRVGDKEPKMEITMHRYASQPVMNFEDYLKNTLHTKKTIM